MPADASTSSTPLPSNIKEAIEEFRWRSVRYFGCNCVPAGQCEHWQQARTARSNLESLFLKQQQEIERLKAKSESGMNQEKSTARTTDPHTTN